MLPFVYENWAFLAVICTSVMFTIMHKTCTAGNSFEFFFVVVSNTQSVIDAHPDNSDYGMNTICL